MSNKHVTKEAKTVSIVKLAISFNLCALIQISDLKSYSTFYFDNVNKLNNSSELIGK